MLLLDSENVTLSSARKVVVISPEHHLQSELAQLLRSYGIENIEGIDSSYRSEDIALDAEETVGVIIDIGDETDVVRITEQVSAIVPQQMWCCLVGVSDSISLAQKLLEQNILYFNADTQLNLMMNRIVSKTMMIPSFRYTVRIGVLGCKGGIGSTFIASRVAAKIAQSKNVPVLLAQGSNGSQDLDLLFDKKLQGDIVEYKDHLSIFNGNVEQIPKNEVEKFNFILIDQPIFNVNKDAYTEFFDVASSFVLVVERHPNSLRIAKRFLDQCARQKAKTGQLIRTFVCIVDSRLEHSRLMSKADIETLLGTPVDAIIPFLKNTNARTVLDVKLNKNQQKLINTLTMTIIGVISRQGNKKEQQSLFKALWQKLIN